ncbi:alpha/beta fold hydrolase [Herbiconiux daphne]|uniref:Alpha/beta hydrolase n=1 Tax=Herbiconiux daphne TaxID=2970914 RepID=A0ABT2H5I4_9MICO|nr:alpha/beta hydrolase [Herbiconiux daphne]MCS5735197.1 alpha/beta hydrolase [Herbiconiux daphne]
MGERLTRDDRRITTGAGVYRVLSSIRAPDAATSGRPRPHAVVLIHGIGTSHRYLAKLHAEFETAGDVYSIDLPGFAGLPKPGTAPGVAAMAAGLARVLDELGVSDAVLVGHSMGAQWVVELAVERPDLAATVVAIGPVADDRHRTLLAQSAALGLDVLGETPAVNAVVLVDYLRCGPVWFLRESRPMLTYPLEDRVALLTMPFLVLRGGNDPIAGTSWCRRLRDRAPHGRFVVVPGHRHVVQFTAPRAVAAGIRSFLAGIAAGEPRAGAWVS